MSTLRLQDLTRLRMDCGRANVEVSALLLQAHPLAELVSDRSNLEWMTRESSGYASGTELPRYRHLPAELLVKVDGEWHAAEWNSTSLRQEHSLAPLPWSVSAVQNALADDSTESVHIQVVGDRFSRFLQNHRPKTPAKMVVAKETLEHVLSAVRLRVSEWVSASWDTVAAALQTAAPIQVDRMRRVFRSNGRARAATVRDPDAMPKIFVAHGHDEVAVERVKNLLLRLGFKPDLLGGEAPPTVTLVERLQERSDVAFAVILLTPDDEGRSLKEPEMHKRARQNVIFEYGYFVQKLSGRRVFPLQKGKVELPSNLGGTLPTDFDDLGAWEHKLADAMKRAGLPVDKNKL